MAPKTTTNPTKLASILAYFHSSGVAHSIKDLEKALPSVGSINSMQVKDYLAALADDNKIHVEKIGSGNWYWSFPSEEKKTLEHEIERLESEVSKSTAQVEELKESVGHKTSARAEEEEDAGGETTREDMARVRDALEVEVKDLEKELAAFSDNDPVEIDKKTAEEQRLKEAVLKWTDDVENMESYFVSVLGVDREGMESLKKEIYGVEYDDETGAMSELGL